MDSELSQALFATDTGTCSCLDDWNTAILFRIDSVFGSIDGTLLVLDKITVP